MSDIQAGMQEIEDRFVAWAKGNPAIRAAFVIGSRARVDHPADDWSDLDLVLIVDEPQRLRNQTDWIAHLGPYWLTFVEPTVAGVGYERRVLFAGGYDVDFATLSAEQFDQIPADLLGSIVTRGLRVLIDKDGRIVSTPPDARPGPPDQDAYRNLVSDFWYHALWTARKLRRGELFTAKRACDGHMKDLLLQMLMWHVGAVRGWTQDTWHKGRFLEEWADPRVLTQLQDAYAHYERSDIARALQATINLFRWLARETADASGLAYPVDTEHHVMLLMPTVLDGTVAPGG